MFTHTHSPIRERRLIALVHGFASNAKNSAREFLETQAQNKTSAAQSPDSRLDEIATNATERVRNVSMRGWRSLGLETQAEAERNVKTLVHEEAQKLAAATERALQLSSNSAIKRIFTIASKCRTRVHVLQEKRKLYERLLTELGAEHADLEKQGESLKKLYGSFDPSNRSAIIQQATRLKSVIEALQKNKAEVEQEYSQTIEAQMEERANKLRDEFVGEIELRCPRMLATVLPRMAEYIAEGSEDLIREIETAQDIQQGDKEVLLSKARALRAGPEAKKSWLPSRRTVLLTTGFIGAGVVTAPIGGLAVFGLGAGLIGTGLATVGTGLAVGGGGLSALGLGRLAKQQLMKGQLWWHTGHKTEQELWQASVASSFASALRQRGALNGPPATRFEKLKTLPKGTQISIMIGKKTVMAGLSSVETTKKGKVFARIVTTDGRHGAIDLSSPQHHFALEKTKNGNKKVFEEEKLIAPDVSKISNSDPNALYLQAA